IWAMQHSKDVYVEKPVSHNVREGRVLVDVSRKTDRICQAGTQSRSAKACRDAMEYIHSGKIGKVTLSRGLCYKLRKSIGKVAADQPVARREHYVPFGAVDDVADISTLVGSGRQPAHLEDQLCIAIVEEGELG